jgi:O-antigen ligase
VLYCVWVIVKCLRDSPRGRGFALVVFALPCVYLWIRDSYLGQKPENTRIIYLLVVAAFWALRPRIKTLAILGYFVSAAVVLSLLLGVLLPAKGIFHSAQGTVIAEDKQVLPFGLLVGIFTQGNNLGQFIVMGIPSVMLIPHRRLRWSFLAASVLALVWSASRGSFVALSMVVVGVLTLKLVKSRRARAAAGFLLGLASMAAVCVLPFSTHSATAYTTRGYIWMQSLQAWSTSREYGLGSAWYRLIGTSSATLGGTVFHGHNQLVQLLVTGGWVLAALVGLLLLLALINAARLAASSTPYGVTFLIALAGSCLFEVSLALVDNTFVIPVMLLPLAAIMFNRELDVLNEAKSADSTPTAGHGHPEGRLGAAELSLVGGGAGTALR